MYIQRYIHIYSMRDYDLNKLYKCEIARKLLINQLRNQAEKVQCLYIVDRPLYSIKREISSSLFSEKAFVRSTFFNGNC